MNVLTIVVSAIFLVFMLLGFKRGLFKTAFKMLSMIIALVLAYIISPIVADVVIQRTNVDEYIKQVITSKIRSDVEGYAELGGINIERILRPHFGRGDLKFIPDFEEGIV